ncbi:MAG: hypothetical protein ACRES9_11440 [Gammaproteobacteria bacterium]
MSSPAIAAVLAVAVLLGGCGGGGSGSGGNPPKPIAEGVYFGLYTTAGSSTPVPVFGAVSPQGYAYFGDIHGTQYVLPDQIEKGGFTGSVTAWAPFGHNFDDGRKSHDYLLAGRAQANDDIVTAIDGVLSGEAGSGSFKLTYQGLSKPAPVLADMAGTYQGYYWESGHVAVSVTLAADGSFEFSDGYGCTGNGQLSVVSGYNLLKVSLDSTGNSTCAGKASGLGFTGTKDLGDFFQNATGTYIYFGASNADIGFIVLLYKSN